MLDLAGQQFGYLVVVEKTKERHHGSVVWLCECLRHTPPKRVKACAAGLRLRSCSCGCDCIEGEVRKRQSFLYVIRQNSPEQFCKIGVTDDPKDRIGELQVGNPYDLEYLYLAPLPLAERRETYERAVHSILRDSHAGGEWFTLTDEVVQKFSDWANSGFPLEVRSERLELRTPPEVKARLQQIAMAALKGLAAANRTNPAVARVVNALRRGQDTEAANSGVIGNPSKDCVPNQTATA